MTVNAISITAMEQQNGGLLRQMIFLANTISEYPSSSCSGILAMMDALYPHRELVCAASNGLPEEIRNYLREYSADDLQVLLKTQDNTDLLAQCAPMTKDYPIPERGAMYYLCENGVCNAPTADFSKLNV